MHDICTLSILASGLPRPFVPLSRDERAREEQAFYDNYGAASLWPTLRQWLARVAELPRRATAPVASRVSRTALPA